ncbi:MAG TPA: glycosyltransferase family 4 protein [Caldilineaceae bacterium]|nr:glycosyltransferase family 4 protein [Caldilineaceae bacterium]
MRICSPQLGLSPTATRGGEVYDVAILTRLAQAGVEIDVLLPTGSPAPTAPNLRITWLPLRRGYRWFVSNFYLAPYIGRCYRDRPFDLLRVHSLRFTGLAALWARRVYHLPVPIVAHHHHTDPDRWTGLVDGRVARQVDLLLVGSAATAADVITRFRVAKQRLAVIPYGIDAQFRPGLTDTLAQTRSHLAGRQVIIHVGSLIPRKNVAGLLAAFAQVRAALPTAYLVLLGSGPEEAALRSQAASLGIADGVEFAGRVDEQTKLAFYGRADLLVSASLMEGFGLAVGEAMACGVPVVATAAGSLPELVEDGVTGLLVPPADQNALATAILYLLQNPVLARRLGQAASERIDRLFRWERTTQQTLALYQQLVNDPAKKPKFSSHESRPSSTHRR